MNATETLLDCGGLDLCAMSNSDREQLLDRRLAGVSSAPRFLSEVEALQLFRPGDRDCLVFYGAGIACCSGRGASAACNSHVLAASSSVRCFLISARLLFAWFDRFDCYTVCTYCTPHSFDRPQWTLRPHAHPLPTSSRIIGELPPSLSRLSILRIRPVPDMQLWIGPS